MTGKIYIIIPNWNGKKFLGACLDSLQKVRGVSFAVVVVDNGSTDGSQEYIKKKYPAVFLLANKRNLGFAAACNQGIKFALSQGAGFVLLLNNDTVVAPDFLKQMLAAFKAGDKVGIVGAKIYYYDNPRQLWFAGGRFIRWRASGQHQYWQKKDKKRLTGIIDSDFITGCAMLVKKDVFFDIGYFYEPYFLTIEDLDFCWRAKNKGWQIKTNLEAQLWHKVSLSRQGEFSFSNGYYGTRNRLFFAFYRSRNFCGGLVFLFLVLPIRFVQWFFQGKLKMIQGASLGVRDFIRGRMGAK